MYILCKFRQLYFSVLITTANIRYFHVGYNYPLMWNITSTLPSTSVTIPTKSFINMDCCLMSFLKLNCSTFLLTAKKFCKISYSSHGFLYMIVFFLIFLFHNQNYSICTTTRLESLYWIYPCKLGGKSNPVTSLLS